MNLNLQTSQITATLKKLNYKDLIIFLIPFAIFLYYLHVYDPGILSVDSYNQLHQIATGQFSNWHPFFHTFIEMICIKIYASPVSIGILQIIVFSSMWMIICKYFRDDDSEPHLKSKIFILQVVITLLISLIPINALYSITLWKDILFSYFLMFLCFLIKVMLDKQGQVSYRFIIIFSLLMAFISQIRPNGIYIVILLMIIFGIYLFRENTEERLYAVMPALTIIFILLIASLNVAYDVENNQKDAIFTKVSHMLADYDLNLNMTPQDQAKVHQLMDEKTIKEKYNITYSDPIWGAANEQVYDNDKGTYIGMAVSYSLSNPIHFLEYLFGSSPMVWDITRDSEWIGSVYKTDINNANRFYYSGNVKPVADFDNAMAANSRTGEYQQLNSFAYFIKDNLITDTLFDSPALYFYLAIVLLVAIHLITKSKDIYLVYLPNFLNILIVFASTPIQDNRYLYPNLLVCYLLIIIFISIITGKYLKNNKDSNNPKIAPVNYPNTQTETMENMQRSETQEEMEARIREKVLKELEKERK